MAADPSPPRAPADAVAAGFDRLAGGRAMQVVLLRDAVIGGDTPIRAPHRHDYHELIWVRSGSGEQRVDGAPLAVRPGTVTIVGRGQVHQFIQATGLQGAVVRFGDELLAGGAQRIVAGWLLTGGTGRTITVPPGEQDRLEALVVAIGAEGARPPDPYSAELQRTLLAAVLLLLERWYDASRVERRTADDADVQVHRRFSALLEQDFVRHHDATYYADALAMPRAALSRVLVAQTGRTTKDLVLDRVMLEAARLLRFTDRGIGEVSHAVGFSDQLYFSRAFKRRFGVAPTAYRDRARGGSPGSPG